MYKLLQLFLSFLKIGTFSYGGGLAVLSLIEKEIVDVKHFISAKQFVDIVTIAQLTPGAIAINAATFSGYTYFGVLGAITASLGLILIPIILVISLASVFEKIKNKRETIGVFKGIAPVVVGLILNAAIVISQTSLTNVQSYVIVVVVLGVLIKYKINPIFCVLSAGVFGAIFL